MIAFWRKKKPKPRVWRRTRPQTAFPQAPLPAPKRTGAVSSIAMVAALASVFALTPLALAQGSQDAPVRVNGPDTADARIRALEERLAVLERALAARAPETLPGVPDAVRAGGQPSGGPVGPAAAVTEAILAERALERTLVRTGALVLPRGAIEIEPGISYQRGQQTSAGFVTTPTGAVAIANSSAERSDTEVRLAARAGLPFDSQAEVQIGFAGARERTLTRVGGPVVESQTRTGQAISDVTVALTKSLVREKGWRPDVLARVTWSSASGTRQDGAVAFGNGFNDVEVGLTALKRQDPLVFVGSIARRETFKRGGIEPGAVTSGSATALLAVSPETSLRFGYVHAYTEAAKAGGRKLLGSDANSGALLLGASSVLSRSTLVDLGLQIGVTGDSPDVVVTLSTPFRLSLRGRRGA